MAADAVLTFAAEGILNKVLSLPAQEFSLVWGFKAQLGKLKQSLTDVERFLVDVADNPQGRPKSIEEWVKKLKDVAEDAEDVLDEFEYEVARRKVEIQNHIKKKVCTAKMNLHDEVDLEDYVSRPDKISAAEISAICQEAGMHAVRKNRYVILPNDFEKGYQTNVKKPDTDFEFYK